MKFLLFSDLHLDRPFKSLKESDVINWRRQALRDALNQIIQLAKTKKVDALLCGGDLYEHNYARPDTARFLRDAFASLHPIPVYIAPGNHDWLGRQSLYLTTEWSDNVHLFREACFQPCTLTDGLTLWGAAHHSQQTTTNFLENFKVDRSGLHLALFHGALQGPFAALEDEPPYAPFAREDIDSAGFRHAFLGHYHTPIGDPLFTYPGNPAPLDFGETGERGAVLVTLSADGQLQHARYKVSPIDLRDVELDVTGCTHEEEIRQRLAGCTRGMTGIARLTVSGTLGIDVELHLDQLPTAAVPLQLYLAPSHRYTRAYDYEAIAREKTVRGQFVRSVQQSDLSEEEKQRVLHAGLRALAGYEDLEVR